MFMQRIVSSTPRHERPGPVGVRVRFEEMNQMTELVDCLFPDMESILFNGKLDRAAINDCCTMMTRRGLNWRNSNMWGLLYYMLLESCRASIDEPQHDRRVDVQQGDQAELHCRALRHRD